jgi:hypothetical protein
VPAALNLLIFRDGRQRVCGPELKAVLLRQLQSLHEHGTREDLLGALLRAGELECAVADAGAASPQPYMSVTDRLAEAFLAPNSSLDFRGTCSGLFAAAVPEALELSRPEGFAYYALHPLAFAQALTEIPGLAGRVAVIGIRTIGVTLSAVTAAAARARGLAAERITVRPVGHPYNRRTQLPPEQAGFVRQQATGAATFLVVDEGPGLSGSTFISVAEALVEAGAPRQRITLVCGRKPDFDSLRADDGPRRARRFSWIAVSTEPRRPAAAAIAVGGGQWRRHLLPDETLWPASWITLERLKYLSGGPSEEKWLYKFLGFGHYGESVFTRESRVAGEGFGLAPRGEISGYASYLWTAGRPMATADISPDVIARLAAYCAFRARAFARNLSDLSALEQMAVHNARELGLEPPLKLRLERPALSDGRMQPHEWLRVSDGRILKTDSGSHGDDHFFPGITDIAWDLAGAIVEWDMSHGHAEAFLRAYHRSSGDDAGPRIADFITAYAVFRCAYCRMAANAVQDAAEQARLERAAARYQDLLAHGSPQRIPVPLP